MSPAGGGSSQPYSSALRESPGATRLVVILGSLASGHAEPELWRDAVFEDLPLHRLYVAGTSEFVLDDITGADLEAQLNSLVAGVADGLGVARENIVCVGSSFAGSAALLVGLALGVGRVVVSAPCIWLGSWLYRLGRAVDPETARVEIFDYMFLRAGFKARPGRLPELDRRIRDRALANTATSLLISASPYDAFFRESAWLVNECVRLGRGEVRLIPRQYPHHEASTPDFYEGGVLRELLLEA